MTTLIERFAAVGIDAGAHPGETGKGRLWLAVGFERDASGAAMPMTGKALRAPARGGHPWGWRIHDAEQLLSLIEQHTTGGSDGKG